MNLNAAQHSRAPDFAGEFPLLFKEFTIKFRLVN